MSAKLKMMTPLLQLFVAAIVEAGLLCVLSYLIFAAGQRLTFTRPGTRGHRLWHVFRLPGNLVHELSHAVVLWLAGFRVVRVQVSLLDRDGRGGVYVRGRWHGLVPASLGWALAAVAPVAGGVVTLVAIFHLLHLAPAAHAMRVDSVGQALVERALGWLAALDYHTPTTYLVLLLICSIGAELAPSERDLRSALQGLLMAAALTAVVAATAYSLPPGSPARTAFDKYATGSLTRLVAAQEMALSVLCGVALLLGVPYLLSEALARGDEARNWRETGRNAPLRDERARTAAARRATSHSGQGGSSRVGRGAQPTPRRGRR
ncbi:MAG: hypothetical protein H5T86_10215 [Armatimonadetes bacterium]|nr:hypothetical protein [Armatimonadota bacterium]